MIKKIIGFNEILNKQVEFIKEYKGYKFYTTHNNINNTAFVELDNDFIIALCNIENINDEIIEQIKTIPNKLLEEYQLKLSNNNLIDGAVREYLFQTNRITEEENNNALEHNRKILEEREQKRLEKEQIKEQEQKEKEKKRQFKLIEAETDFKNNKMISSNDFIGLCEKYNINLPIKLIGWINSKASEIGVNGYKSWSKSTTICRYAKQLQLEILTN